MNFLELCQETARIAEITGGGPRSVVSQTGENLDVVRWTREAWVDIQNLQLWDFLRKELLFPTVAGQQYYTRAQMGASDMRKVDEDTLRIYRDSVGTSDEQYLVGWDWEVFWNTYGFAQQAQGRPNIFTIRRSDKAMGLGQIPDSGDYKVRGWYWSRAVRMALDADEPAIDEELQMVIPYRAVMHYANREAAAEVKQEAVENYGPLMDRMYEQYLPAVSMGGPLA